MPFPAYVGPRMNNRDMKPPPRDGRRRPPVWSGPLWYLPLMLVMLWLWQSAVTRFAYKTIPYSEFKDHLRKGEVAECIVKDTTIEGSFRAKPTPTTAESNSNAHAATNANDARKSVATDKPVYFRTVRVEDKDL